MNEFDFQNLGQQISDAVSDALHSKEFTELKTNIKTTVRDAAQSVQTSFHTPIFQQQPTVRTQQSMSQPQPSQMNVPYVQRSSVRGPRFKIPGNVASVLLLVFGFIGLGAVLLGVLISGIASLISQTMGLFTGISLGVFLPLLAAFLIMVGCGFQMQGRVKRFKAYMQRMKGDKFCPIEMLASATGQTKKFVIKDLKKMIRLGFFPDGHLDDEQTCLMLDYETYRYYLDAKENMRKQQELEDEFEENSALAEGRRYIRQIREANDAIPAQDVSEKLDRLENITTRIFDCVEERPEKMPEIRKFMNYYLPTTLKLVNAYRDFYEQPVMSQNIAGARQNIENALDTINTAFENLLDSLYQDDAMDVSTDISVLKSMLAQEGLTGKDSQKKSKEPPENPSSLS